MADSSLSPLLRLIERTADSFVRREIYRQAGAKAFVLSAYADAESGGEGLVFQRAKERVRDPRLVKLIDRHEADEDRHARLFADARAALGLEDAPIPAHLKTIELLSAAADHVLDRPLASDADVVAAYALLYVVEERALVEFGRAESALRATGDDATADVFAQVARDERRHLGYCRALGRHYVGEDAFEAEIGRMRRLEAGLYVAQSAAFTDHLLATGRLALRGMRGLMIRAILAFARQIREPVPANALLPAVA